MWRPARSIQDLQNSWRTKGWNKAHSLLSFAFAANANAAVPRPVDCPGAVFCSRRVMSQRDEA
jgi:hypothetical protein